MKLTVRAVIALKAEHRLELLLDLTGFARSTFFYHQARLRAPNPQERIETAVTEIFEENHGRYEHRRIHRDGQARVTVAKKTVLKVMRSVRLVCKVRRTKVYNSYQGEQGNITLPLTC